MQNKQTWKRFGFVAISLLVLLSLLAITLPEKVQAASTTDPNANFTQYIKNGRIYVSLAAPRERVKYRVRLKDSSISQPKFYDAGWLITDQKVAKSASYLIPAALKKTLHIDVCLKNQSTNRLTCHKIYNPGL